MSTILKLRFYSILLSLVLCSCEPLSKGLESLSLSSTNQKTTLYVSKDNKQSEMKNEVGDDQWNDSNHFTSLGSALTSLSAADHLENIEILIWPDTYFGENITFNPANTSKSYKSLKIKTLLTDGAIASFDGRDSESDNYGLQPYFFKIVDDIGVATNISIESIQVEYYAHGIQFLGPSDFSKKSK